MFEVPFDYLAHFVTVPVTLNGVETTFIFDSGIGCTMVRDTFAGCVPNGESFLGKRMSGQEVVVPLGTASIRFGDEERPDELVGLVDMSGFPDALDHIGGFLSLPFFAESTVTVDYPRQLVRVGARPEGTTIPCHPHREGPALTLFMGLTLPDGREVEVEVDMGSDCLILDDRFRELGAAEERREDGTDPLGAVFTRRFTTLPGRIHASAAPDIAQDDPAVMFQSIIYDGLVGEQFLRPFAVTFDVAASTITLS